jgi:murein DD-endopeptidase MepM/ murein hydrolase activator NlpD
LSERTLWKRLLLAILALGAMGAVGLAWLLPAAAQADSCTVTVTLVTGQTLTFTVNVAPGTPVSQIPLPVSVGVKSVSESCAQTATTTGTTTTSTTPTSTSTSTTTTTTTPPTTSTSTSTTPTSTSPTSAPPKPKGKGHPEGETSRGSHHRTSTTPARAGRGSGHGAHGARAHRSGAAGAPVGPAVSYALPTPAAIGVPNFFIDDFQIPPFLLPIYQAAGIEYDVPWQVLAAINWIETDYGRDLNVSSAGAVGWMQFLPSTWREYGVDATGSGYADPYNPTDAIFAAARYLAAAGAATNLPRAIFAYNHAEWYVQSVLLRAQLIGGIPQGLISSLTELVEGHFPVAAAATYANSSVDRLAGRRIYGGNAAIDVGSDPTSTGTAIYARHGSPVIAVNDGRILAIGHSRALGRYVILQDQQGNVYTYADLGSVPARYPVPKPVQLSARNLARELSVSPPRISGAATIGAQAPAPTASQSATAGNQAAGQSSAPLAVTLHPAPLHPRRATVRHRPARGSRGAAATSPVLPKERLFAHPNRPASYAAGGAHQLTAAAAQITNFRDYFSDVLHLGRDQYTMQPLRPGAEVVAGTIIGRIGAATTESASHLWFMIQPGGRNAPYIDPKPILDGWELLQATAVYRAAGKDPFVGQSPSIGQILLESKSQLETQVLNDPHVSVYACGRRDIQAGLIDQRILATIEFLSHSGLDPTISGLACGAGSNGIDPAGATGASMDISAVNGIPVLGHQGPGSITDITIRRLLTLQGAMKPTEIISLMSYRGETNTLALPDHANRIQVTFTPDFGDNKALSGKVRSILRPKQWVQLIQRIGEIPEPSVPVTRSPYAIRVSGSG